MITSVDIVDQKTLGMLRKVQEQFENPQWCFLVVNDSDFLRHRHTPENDESNFSGKPIRFSRMAAERVARELEESPLRLRTSIIPEILGANPKYGIE